jgi:hypothetical protein
MEGQQAMPSIHAVKFAFDDGRRLAALGCLTMASWLLRGSLALYRRGVISTKNLRVGLLAAKSFQQSAVALSFGSKRRQVSKHDGRSYRP